MRFPSVLIMAVLAGLAGLVAGCAQGPMHKDAGRASLHCPASHTMVCEANTVGRMRHGTFANNTKKCGCVPDSVATLESPVIPSIH